jgi:23S rRNA pseudouridine2457 synthase
VSATITIALNKPFGFLSRFTSDGSANRPLADVEPRMPKDVWPVGRLDADSEGLLVLSSDKALVDKLLSPKRTHDKTYAVQVERVPDDAALAKLCDGSIELDGARVARAHARMLGAVSFAERDPPIRFRKSVPTAWIELTITEGRNRQVRRMTAAVGHPTLRLVRTAIGTLTLASLALPVGGWRLLEPREIERLLSPSAQ